MLIYQFSTIVGINDKNSDMRWRQIQFKDLPQIFVGFSTEFLTAFAQTTLFFQSTKLHKTSSISLYLHVDTTQGYKS